jgi:hypothetical protein
MACKDLRQDFFSVIENSPSSLPNTIIISARWSLLVERFPFDNGEGGVESGNSWEWSIPKTGGTYSDNMRVEIVSSIKTILETGKTVILVYPVPEMGWDVTKVLTQSQDVIPPNDLGSVSYDGFLQRSKNAIEALDSIGTHKNLVRIRPDEILCNDTVEQRCIAHLNGEALYFDSNHLSNEGAELLVREILRHISH